MRDLPTIEYVTAEGVRRELSLERCPDAPWRAVLVEREDRGDGLEHVGTQPLRELRVDGEPVTPVAAGIAEVFRGP
ncbi:hypothetical protein [Haloparvum sedimenti]|uniref:hypothetical protein n=1 Tax=Haloparvum sedimenti TaxID=1678448 RepID=UPI00071E706F|nr:hypothetical protein [Haloparvum sedimenti]